MITIQYRSQNFIKPGTYVQIHCTLKLVAGWHCMAQYEPQVEGSGRSGHCARNRSAHLVLLCLGRDTAV